MPVVYYRCIELSLKPYMGRSSQNFIKEAVKPLVAVEREKDVALVEECVEQFAATMRRHIRSIQIS
jgi:hypothetical protein